MKIQRFVVFTAVLSILLSASCSTGSDGTLGDPPQVTETPTPTPAEAPAKLEPAALAFTLEDIKGNPVPLKRYLGKVVLMVNVASKCGFTRQYEGLQKLNDTLGSKGLAILGFPANNFGAQEPGTNEEILQFCTGTYNVTFDMFGKISVKGDDIAPLYAYLTSDKVTVDDPGPVKWNFEKFLISRSGQVIGRYRSGAEPAQLVPDIEKALAAPAPSS